MSPIIFIIKTHHKFQGVGMEVACLLHYAWMLGTVTKKTFAGWMSKLTSAIFFRSKNRYINQYYKTFMKNGMKIWLLLCIKNGNLGIYKVFKNLQNLGYKSHVRILKISLHQNFNSIFPGTFWSRFLRIYLTRWGTQFRN